MVLSTTAAGTINQIARGLSNSFTSSASEDVPTAFSSANRSTAAGDLSKTTHWWPPSRSRRTILAPIRPSPIIPICMISPYILFESHSPGSLTWFQTFIQRQIGSTGVPMGIGPGCVAVSGKV
jgi:hypothetical protein